MDAFIDETGARIARRVRLEREARGWSQADLAERSGVSKAAISKVEREEASLVPGRESRPRPPFPGPRR